MNFFTEQEELKRIGRRISVMEKKCEKKGGSRLTVLFEALRNQDAELAVYLVREYNGLSKEDICAEIDGKTPIELASQLIDKDQAVQLCSFILEKGGSIDKLPMKTTVQHIVWENHLSVLLLEDQS